MPAESTKGVTLTLGNNITLQGHTPCPFLRKKIAEPFLDLRPQSGINAGTSGKDPLSQDGYTGGNVN
jgi:hypothetical protein